MKTYNIKVLSTFDDENIFKYSFDILNNRSQYEKEKNFKTIELFYRAFFFFEFYKDEQANDFTFYSL